MHVPMCFETQVGLREHLSSNTTICLVDSHPPPLKLEHHCFITEKHDPQGYPFYLDGARYISLAAPIKQVMGFHGFYSDVNIYETAALHWDLSVQYPAKHLVNAFIVVEANYAPALQHSIDGEGYVAFRNKTGLKVIKKCLYMSAIAMGF